MALVGLNNALEKEVLDFFFSGTAMTAAPATWYFALFTVAPNDDGTGGTEVTGTGYARVSMTNNATNFPAATAGDPTTKSNGTKVDFGTVGVGGWGTVVAWAVFTASSGGTPQIGGTITPNKTLDSGDTAEIAVSSMTVRMSNS